MRVSLAMLGDSQACLTRTSRVQSVHPFLRDSETRFRAMRSAAPHPSELSLACCVRDCLMQCSRYKPHLERRMLFVCWCLDAES